MEEPGKYYSKVKKKSHKSLHITWFHFYEVSRIGKSLETGSRLAISKAEERGERGIRAYGVRFLFEVLKVFSNWLQCCLYNSSNKLKTSEFYPLKKRKRERESGENSYSSHKLLGLVLISTGSQILGLAKVFISPPKKNLKRKKKKKSRLIANLHKNNFKNFSSFWPHCAQLVESQIPKQGLNPGHGSESLESQPPDHQELQVTFKI